MAKPKVGVFGLTGCAGDQLVLLNCEDELLTIVDLLDIRSFIMASSAADHECELDIALVEGAVVTPRDESLVRRVRARSHLLVALGTCAAWGGVARTQALNKFVAVDAVIPGCPVEKDELLNAISNLLRGQPPLAVHYPVCAECKMRENECLLVTGNAFCVGSVTLGGCHARCPSIGVGCIGCRGPAPDANFASAAALFAARGYAAADINRRLHAFAPEAV